MDKLDEKIIEILKENSKLSTRKISKKLMVPITTVYHRIKRLENNGIIKNYTVSLNYKKLGKCITAYTLIIPDYERLKNDDITPEELVDKIKKNKTIENISLITGRFDIILKIRVNDIEELNRFNNNFLLRIHGISKTETLIVLKE
ncbi:MAG: Lrp/AsnC family transcriptional regulator [Candidatus Aenigmarchaeota archaeon]|nr:Lrp/AsnC family transcriptional regulator [Candidatus Aenigmarchaeota archaeon]